MKTLRKSETACNRNFNSSAMLHIVDVSKEYIAVIFTVEEFTLVLEYMGLEDTGTTIF